MSIFHLSRNQSFDLVLCVISLVLVFLAPNTYSYDYCLLIHNLFLLTFAYNLIKNRKDGLLSFNLLFTVSFYCTSFIYPVFFYNTSDRYFSMFSYSFDENIITYSTAISYMAYCFLQLGLNNKGKNTGDITNFVIENVRIEKSLSFLTLVFTLFFIYFILNDGLKYFSDQFANASSKNDGIMAYFVQFLSPIAYSIFIMAFFLKNKRSFTFVFAVSIVGLFALLILLTGSRTIPLSIISLALFLFNDKISKLGVVKLAMLGVSFVVIMVLAGSLRGNGDMINSSNISENASDVIENNDNIFLFAEELIICNRNLYFLIGTTDNIGYTYGATVLGSVLSVVPFLSNLFLSVTGLPEAAINSAKYNTVLSGVTTKGLGTHAVADIYICWGILGVMIIFYLYGFIITKFKCSSNKILYSVAYYIIISNAIYACRATIFNLSQILWTVGIVYLVLKMSGNKTTLTKTDYLK